MYAEYTEEGEVIEISFMTDRISHELNGIESLFSKYFEEIF